MYASLRKTARELLQNALQTSITLFKIIIPISIITRLLQQWGIIDYIGIILAPVMKLVGLPGEMGLVWATSMITNIYGGMVVFASLAPGLDLTVAQVSVLGTMILIAHSLPVEVMIAKKTGTRLRITLTIRLAGALLLGWILHVTYTLTDTLQQTNRAFWNPPTVDPTWSAWILAELRNMVMIFLIILTLMTILTILKKVGISDLMTRLLAPIMNILGIGREAAPITIIGMTLGISYGGGLIIHEAQKGNLSRRDLFASVTLMSLCHSLFEDTLLMVVLGSHLSGILFARMLFSMVVIYLLVKLINKMPEHIFNRHLVRQVNSPGNKKEDHIK